MNTKNQDFEVVLRAEIRKTIRGLVATGTVAMGLRNLQQVVRMGPDTYNLAGAPKGPADYATLFNRVATETKDIAVFLIN